LAELPCDAVRLALSASVEEVSWLTAVASFFEARVHPSELHTKFHVLGCAELSLPTVPAIVPVSDIEPSEESISCTEPPVGAVVAPALWVSVARGVVGEGKTGVPVDI
jgi:hypothetical protein